MIPLAAFAVAACAAVSPDSDRVLLRDIAAAFPSIAAAAADTPVGLAPAPGVERRFDLPELGRVAARLRLPEAPVRSVCVIRPAAPLAAARILAAMRAALPDATIELLDYSHWPVPEGTLEFPAALLRRDLWPGTVRYAGNRRVRIWARVRVHGAGQRAVAAHDLKTGQRLGADDLRGETGEPVPAEWLGKRLRRAVRTGEPVLPEWLDTLPAVAAGEAVQVEVHNGAAVVAFEGRAQSAGKLGQTVAVLNPRTHKRFQARVSGPGRVSLEGGSL
jgi:flagella basal body P-ring formation protein FlgA